ncbi:MerR family transcriptional regulator [Methylomonas sp. EFPC3]|uniref:MerR family transcriptional regulator n=1 Tax=Methylomonas sp. EFPC3 TaxID=3021710 RepID=UPI002415C759|nr:MerR family transcriptional regulator [Methylomonas sp. EFPC3]WFP48908.1 MerR family transcriptional regulator [Methylomonas sp. EFPC3]
MLLKVGELAKRCGLTVRTLHHYDSIGLLKPSARSDTGYRLYQRGDIARLHQIQALRQFGLSLAEIGDILAIVAYIQSAFVESKLRIYEKYLSADEFSVMRANYGKQADAWPPLIAAIRQHLEDGTPPSAPEMQALARTWLGLFRAYAGDNPDTHAKIRAAHQAEPYLFFGTFIDPPLLAYVYQAMAQLGQAPTPAQAH